MPQFFVTSADIKGNICKICGDDFHHLTRVRRISLDDIIQLKTDNGASLEARVVQIQDHCIEAEIIRENAGTARHVKVVLYLCLLKGKDFDKALRQAVEIGVSAIVPVVSERTVSNPGNRESKTARWEKISLEAAKQSFRDLVPEVRDIVRFRDLTAQETRGVKILAHPGAEMDMKEFLRNCTMENEVHLLIGPEGGFSADELRAAQEARWTPVNFGFSHLRAGTAAAVLPAVVIYEWSENDENKG